MADVRADTLALFDASAPVAPDELTGVWRGAELPTGNMMDGLLEATGWYGKRFTSPEEVDPLLFFGPRGKLVRVNPALMPMGAPPQVFELTKAARRAVRPVVASLRTFRPAARLREVRYCGVVSTAMLYDDLPILDHFRRLNQTTLIGAMDYRKNPDPLFFTLRAVPAEKAPVIH